MKDEIKIRGHPSSFIIHPLIRGGLGVLLGGVSEVEQSGERRKDGMAIDAANARGGFGEVGQSGQRRSVLVAASRTDGSGLANKNELHTGRCRQDLAAHPA